MIVSVLKIVQNEQKWLINVSEEPDMINTTLDNERSLKQIFIRYWFVTGVSSI